MSTTEPSSLSVDQEVDARGLVCPLPILKAKKALNGMESGQLLRVFATDRHSTPDFQAFARQTGHTLIEQRIEGDVHIHILRRR